MIGEVGLSLLNVIRFIIIPGGLGDSSMPSDGKYHDPSHFSSLFTTQQGTRYLSINNTTPRSETNYTWVSLRTQDNGGSPEIHEPIYARWVSKIKGTYYLCSASYSTSCPTLGNDWMKNDGKCGVIWNGPFYVKWYYLPLHTVQYYCTFNNVLDCPKPYVGHWRSIEGLLSSRVKNYFGGPWWVKVIDKNPYFCNATLVSRCPSLPGGCWKRKYRGEFSITLFKGIENIDLEEMKKIQYDNVIILCVRKCLKVIRHGIPYQWSPISDQEKIIWNQITKHDVENDWNTEMISSDDDNYEDKGDKKMEPCEKVNPDDEILRSLENQQRWDGLVKGIHVVCFAYSVRTCQIFYGMNNSSPLKKLEKHESPGTWISILGETKLFCSSQEKINCPYLNKKQRWRKFQPRIVHQKLALNLLDENYPAVEISTDDLEWYNAWSTESRDGIKVICYAQEISECQNKSGLLGWEDLISKSADEPTIGRWAERAGDTIFFCTERIIDKCFSVPGLKKWTEFSSPVYKKDYSDDFQEISNADNNLHSIRDDDILRSLKYQQGWEAYVEGKRVLCYAFSPQYCRRIFYGMDIFRPAKKLGKGEMPGTWILVLRETKLFCGSEEKKFCPLLGEKQEWHRFQPNADRELIKQPIKYSSQETDKQIADSLEWYNVWEMNAGGGVNILCYAHTIIQCRDKSGMYEWEEVNQVRGDRVIVGKWISRIGDTSFFCNEPQISMCSSIPGLYEWREFSHAAKDDDYLSLIENKTPWKLVDKPELLCYSTRNEYCDFWYKGGWKIVEKNHKKRPITGKWAAVSNLDGSETVLFCRSASYSECPKLDHEVSWVKFNVTEPLHMNYDTSTVSTETTRKIQEVESHKN